MVIVHLLLTVCWSSLQSTGTFGCFQFLGVLAGHLVLCIFPNALTYFASVFSQNLQAVSAHIILRLFLVRFKKSLQRLDSFMSPLDWSIPGKFAQYNAPNRTVVLSCFKFLVKIYFIVVLSLDVSDSRCPSDTHRWTSLWSNLLGVLPAQIIAHLTIVVYMEHIIFRMYFYFFPAMDL